MSCRSSAETMHNTSLVEWFELRNGLQAAEAGRCRRAQPPRKPRRASARSTFPHTRTTLSGAIRRIAFADGALVSSFRRCGCERLCTASGHRARPDRARLRIWRGTGNETAATRSSTWPSKTATRCSTASCGCVRPPTPDLAFQFSCFNANVCKECAMLHRRRVRYACIAKLKPGLTSSIQCPINACCATS